MSQTVDVDLINAFWQSTRDVMQVMGDLVIKRKRVFVKPDQSMSGRYYAVIGLSQGMVGNVSACFPKDTAQAVVAALFAEETEDDDLLMDAVGEICNLTTGGGKQLLTEGDYQFEISPPTTVVNRDEEEMTVFNPDGTVCIVIDCVIAEHRPCLGFTIELAFQTESRDQLRERKRQLGYLVPQPAKKKT
jgi:chemotaxis protein CheX